MLRKILHSRSNTDTSYFDDTGSRVNNEYLEESEGDSSKNHTRETYVRDKIPEPRSYTKKKGDTGGWEKKNFAETQTKRTSSTGHEIKNVSA